MVSISPNRNQIKKIIIMEYNTILPFTSVTTES